MIVTVDVRRLDWLKRKSVQLLKRAAPWSARLIRLYPHLDTADVRVFQARGELPPDRLSGLAEAAGISNQEVSYLGDLYVRPDSIDVQSRYELAIRHYKRSGLSEELLLSTMSSSCERGRLFLLYGVLRVWDDFAGEVRDLLIEPRSDDDLIPDAIEGLLASNGLGFHTSLELLECSFEQQWAEWQSLWRQM